MPPRITLRKIFGANVLLIGACIVIDKYVSEERKQNTYKNTDVYKEALSSLKSHKGATYFLGETITDGRLTVHGEKKDNNTTMYSVRVPVFGEKDSGIMYLWLRRNGEEKDVDLRRIELAVTSASKRLLVMNKDAQEQMKG